MSVFRRRVAPDTRQMRAWCAVCGWHEVVIGYDNAEAAQRRHDHFGGGFFTPPEWWNRCVGGIDPAGSDLPFTHFGVPRA